MHFFCKSCSSCPFTHTFFAYLFLFSRFFFLLLQNFAYFYRKTTQRVFFSNLVQTIFAPHTRISPLPAKQYRKSMPVARTFLLFTQGWILFAFFRSLSKQKPAEGFYPSAGFLNAMALFLCAANVGHFLKPKGERLKRVPLLNRTADLPPPAVKPRRRSDPSAAPFSS